MDFTCTHETLLKGLASCAPIAGRNTQLPILSSLILRGESGAVTLVATDLEVGLQTTMNGKLAEEGVCAVPARPLLEYVQQLPGSHPIHLEHAKGVLRVTTEGFAAQFSSVAPDEYPLLPSPPQAGERLRVSGERLCQALGRVVFAAARDATRPEIHGVYVSVGGDTPAVTVAATDSFRLAEDMVTLDADGSPAVTLLLPLHTAQEIVRLFAGVAEVEVIEHEGHAWFHSEGLELSSRLIDGTYPHYQKIIPDSFVATGSIDRTELLRALKTLTVFLPRDSRRVRVVVDPAKDVVRLRAEGAGIGEGDVSVPFSGDGKKLTLLFNVHYLLEGVQKLTGDVVDLSFAGSDSPAVFRPHVSDGDEAPTHTYVVMPIQA